MYGKFDLGQVLFTSSDSLCKRILNRELARIKSGNAKDLDAESRKMILRPTQDYRVDVFSRKHMSSRSFTY
jgi:hypothetical protein